MSTLFRWPDRWLLIRICPAAILYERLVTYDNCTLLLSPFGDGRPAYAVAEKYGLPIVNIGDYSAGPPRLRFLFLTPRLTFEDQALQLLAAHTAGTTSGSSLTCLTLALTCR